MNSKLIKLEDETLIEVETSDDELREVSAKDASWVASSMDKIRPILLKACHPIAMMFQEIDQEMQIEQAEVEIGFSFESEGNLYITKATATSNLKVKLTLKPRVKP
jgi:Ni2+-binding GTPase involved in maturation of urease and hydrogenase